MLHRFHFDVLEHVGFDLTQEADHVLSGELSELSRLHAGDKLIQLDQLDHAELLIQVPEPLVHGPALRRGWDVWPMFARSPPIPPRRRQASVWRTRCIFTKFTRPRTTSGAEPTIMTVSPISTSRRRRSSSSRCTIMASVLSSNVVAKHCTPHHNARRRAVVSCSVNAMSGSWGRSFDSNCAVRPDRVITTMARARTSWAMVAAACAIEMVVLRSAGPRAPNMDGVDDSAARAMRSIIVTASTGYSPTAVSADSITASVPSRIAFATSEVS